MLMKLRKIFLVFGSAVLIAGIALAVFVYFEKRNLIRRAEKDAAAVISNEKETSRVLGEEENSFVSQFMSSENFRASDLSLGSQALVFPSGQQAIDPKIVDLRSELLTTKGDGDVKFLISWKTTKPCISSVTYKKEGETKEKIISENDFGYLHSATLSTLSFSTSYSYQVSAKDKWGNAASAEKLAFYTGAPDVSIFDLLGGAFKDMFGWAGR